MALLSLTARACNISHAKIVHALVTPYAHGNRCVHFSNRKNRKQRKSFRNACEYIIKKIIFSDRTRSSSRPQWLYSNFIHTCIQLHEYTYHSVQLLSKLNWIHYYLCAFRHSGNSYILGVQFISRACCSYSFWIHTASV